MCKAQFQSMNMIANFPHSWHSCSGKAVGKKENKDIKTKGAGSQGVMGIMVKTKQAYTVQRHKKIVLYLVLDDDIKLRSPGNHIHNPRKSLLLTLLQFTLSSSDLFLAKSLKPQHSSTFLVKPSGTFLPGRRKCT